MSAADLAAGAEAAALHAASAGARAAVDEAAAVLLEVLAADAQRFYLGPTAALPAAHTAGVALARAYCDLARQQAAHGGGAP